MSIVQMSSSAKGIKLVMAGLLLVAFLCWGNVYGGGGEYEDGRFNLLVSIRHDASPQRICEWREAFQRASDLLYDATDGQHQFGTIFVCNKCLAGRNADIHLFADTGRSYVNLPLPGLGRVGAHMFLYGDERGKPFVIVHEFGHYGYGLYDEYAGPSGGAECVEFSPDLPEASTASIMEGGWWQAPGVDGGDGLEREISEFCVPEIHDWDQDTEQEHQYHKSCWETMAEYYPDLHIPEGLPNEGPICGAAPIVWIELEPETRLVLCIDRSGSMNSPSWKMEYAKLGAQLFVDLAEIGDRIGVVSYGSEAFVDFPLTEVAGDETRGAAKAAIEALSAAGATAMGDGLRESLNQITSPGDTACQQAIILLSNGFQNSGEEDPLEVTPDIREEMTRVFTIGIGDDVNEELLQAIAAETNGKYFRVRSPQDLPAVFGLLSMEVKDGGFILNEQGTIAQGEQIGKPVRMSDTDDGAAFEITWEGSDLDLILIKPDGSVVDPEVASGDPNIEFVGTSRYEFYRVTSPDTGVWQMVIKGVEVSGQTAYTAQVLASNKTISFDVTTDKGEYQFPAVVLVQAQACFGLPIKGVEIYGKVVRPDGSEIPITLFDDGEDIHGDQFADDGHYSNYFSSYNEDGSYTFALIAENTGGGSIIDGGEPLRPDDLGGPQLGPPIVVSLFKRWASTTVVVSGVPEFGSISGHITGPQGGLLGVPVDLVDSQGELFASATSDDAGYYSFTEVPNGDYEVEVQVPLGYTLTSDQSVPVTVEGGDLVVDFTLEENPNTGRVRQAWWWWWQVKCAIRGWGWSHYSGDELLSFLGQIHTHFDPHFPIYAGVGGLTGMNQVLSTRFRGPVTERARKHFFATLLNVVSGRLNTFQVVSCDGATASQAITYMAMLLSDDDPGNDRDVILIALYINCAWFNLPSGVIPLDIPPIAYKFGESPELPAEFALSQNYPNPFNAQTEIRYALPQASHVTLLLYNVAGQRMRTLLDRDQEAGYYTFTWDGGGLASGIYFYRLKAGDFVQTKKLILLK